MLRKAIVLLFLLSIPIYVAAEQLNTSIVISKKDCSKNKIDSGIEFVCSGEIKNIGTKDVKNIIVSIIDPNAQVLERPIARHLEIDKETTSAHIKYLRSHEIADFTISWLYLIPPMQLGLEANVEKAIKSDTLKYEILYDEVDN